MDFYPDRSKGVHATTSWCRACRLAHCHAKIPTREVVCERCATRFTVLGRRKRRFCSEKCSDAWHSCASHKRARLKVTAERVGSIEAAMELSELRRLSRANPGAWQELVADAIAGERAKARQKECTWCGAPFIAIRASKALRFCSYSCLRTTIRRRYYARHIKPKYGPYPRTCRRCGTAFVSMRKDNVFCTKTCKSVFRYWQRNPERRKSPSFRFTPRAAIGQIDHQLSVVAETTMRRAID